MSKKVSSKAPANGSLMKSQKESPKFHHELLKATSKSAILNILQAHEFLNTLIKKHITNVKS